MGTRVPVIVNGSAGQGAAAAAADKLGEVLGEAGVNAEVIAVERASQLTAAATEAAQGRPPAVIAGGGDGTINAVASALAGSDVPLGVLPMGTLNHFAKDVGVPLDLSEAARAIAGGHTAAVDVGEVNGRIFLNNSSLGLYPHIVRDREHQRRRLGRGKWPALAWATWAVLGRSPFLNVRLCLDDVIQECRASFVFIGNNEYVMEGFNIGARERLDRGRLSIYLSRRRSRGRLVMLALRALIGRLQQAKDFDALTAQTIVVETRHRNLMVATDGEVFEMTTPLEYRIRPRALRVLVPAPADGD